MVAGLQRPHAGPQLDDHSGTFVPEHRRKDSLRVCPRQGICVGVSSLRDVAVSPLETVKMSEAVSEPPARCRFAHRGSVDEQALAAIDSARRTTG